MKKGIIMLLAPMFGFFGLFGLIAVLVMGGGAEPVEIIATAEQAEQYQYVGSELGIPWDIVMLADAIEAKNAGKTSLAGYNPLITSLEFCLLEEEEYELKETVTEEGTTTSAWTLKSSKTYNACDEILNYIGYSRSNLEYTHASLVVQAIKDRADGKASEKLQYTATLLANQDHAGVLRERIKMKEDYVKAVLDLYEAKYLPRLYGYLQADLPEGQLPEVVVGQVTREELLKVAASIINWPYMMGGKSSAKGLPTGPLDCSGYVDWVYVQCFGKGVTAGGKLPSGVAVAGTAIQFYASAPIQESQLQIGDLGFLHDPATLPTGKTNHVGIYAGEIGGQHAFIHCGGKYYGNENRPNGRAGISVEQGTNDQIPTMGGTFSPPMKSCKFHYFRRPAFQFAEGEGQGSP